MTKRTWAIVAVVVVVLLAVAGGLWWSGNLPVGQWVDGWWTSGAEEWRTEVGLTEPDPTLLEGGGDAYSSGVAGKAWWASLVAIGITFMVSRLWPGDSNHTGQIVATIGLVLIGCGLFSWRMFGFLSVPVGLAVGLGLWDLWVLLWPYVKGLFA